MKMKKMAALVLCTALAVGVFSGCGGSTGNDGSSSGEGSSSDDRTDQADSQAGSNEDSNNGELKELTMLVGTDTTAAGFEAVAALAEETLGIKVTIETRPGGTDGDNVVKTRLASGDMADLCVYNSGALLSALNPSEYLIDISGETFTDRLDDTYKESVSIDGVTYGIPYSSTQAGVVLYSKKMYEEYNLEVPKTWEEFMANCDVLKEAGETAILGTFADSWTSQVTFLGDNYNVIAQEPDFVKNFEAGEAKYATSPGALRSFEKLADTASYYNEDYLAATYDDGCDMIANGEAGHWFMLTMVLSNIYELYGDDVNNIGVFAVPGDDASDNGLTVWMPESIYGNKNSENIDVIKEFMEFYVSDKALDAYTNAVLPDGPYCIKGYELPDNAYDAVAADMQTYFDSGKTEVAMEFLTPVKGSDCAAICQELGSGQTTAEQAAAKYDEDCAKQATQLGLDW